MENGILIELNTKEKHSLFIIGNPCKPRKTVRESIFDIALELVYTGNKELSYKNTTTLTNEIHALLRQGKLRYAKLEYINNDIPCIHINGDKKIVDSDNITIFRTNKVN